MRAVGPLCVLTLLGAPGVTQAQAGGSLPGDVVFVAVGADFAPGTGGASVSADWLHPVARGSVRAGLESATSGLMQWVVGRIGGGWRLSERLAGDVLGSLGPGSSARERFWYRQVRASASYAVIPRRLFLDGEGQAFNIASVRGQIIAGGVTVLPRGGVQARVSYGRSAGGSYDSEYFLVRADCRNEGVGALGGFSAGRSGPTAQELSLASSQASRWEIFAGVVIPIRDLEVTAVLSHAWSEAVRRESIVLTSRIPLR